MTKRRREYEKAIDYMVIDDGRWIKERGTFSSFWELLDKHNDEEMNLFYGAYCDDRLRYTLCDGITLKQYTTWFKFESTEPEEESCSPYETLETFMGRCGRNYLQCIVSQGGKNILQDKILTWTIAKYNASMENPLCIASHLSIPVTVTGETQMKRLKVSEDIDAYVKKNYGDACFAVIQSEILHPGESCISAMLNEFNGFVVKSWIVKIQRANVPEKDIDLRACTRISNVLCKVKGEAAYNNHELLLSDKLLRDVIINSEGDCVLFVTSSFTPARFQFSESVSHAAKPTTEMP